MSDLNGKIPRHVALIMDGNGRWARQRNKTRSEGHSAGTKSLRPIIKSFFALGVSNLSFYGFSTENWNRPKSEIGGIFSLLIESVDRELSEIADMKLKFVHIGDKQGLPMKVRKALIKMEKATDVRDHKGIIALAFNYGSRAEIVDAAKTIVRDFSCPNEINQELVNRHLHTTNMPEVDLLIRTGGEKRLSNFLLWQSVNAKLVTIDTLWPDFKEEDVKAILQSYKHL